MILSPTLYYGTIQYDLRWRGMNWHGMEWSWYGIVRYGKV